MNTKREPVYIRQEWADRAAAWPAREYGTEIHCPVESWRFEFEEFAGAWMLEDAGRHLNVAAAALCVARMLVARVAARAVHGGMRAEDLADEIGWAHAYLGALKLAPLDVWSAKRALAALQPFDPGVLGAELLRISLMAADDGFELTARALAQLAYDAAARCAVHDAAQTAALALARLAALQECPRTARRWRAIAHLHGRHARQEAEEPPLEE